MVNRKTTQSPVGTAITTLANLKIQMTNEQLITVLPKTFHAINECLKVAGWELADVLKKESNNDR